MTTIDAPRARSRRKIVLLLLVVLAAALAVVALRVFVFRIGHVQSAGMEGTFTIKDRVLINTAVYDFRDPRRGEIVAFDLGRWGGQAGTLSFKRVVGLPGETVACCDADGRVTVDGRALDESAYLSPERDSPLDAPTRPGQCGSRAFPPVKVAPGQLFVLGDHRAVSIDSRCAGTVSVSSVVGRASALS